MELRLTARRGENLLVTIVIPVVVLLFFASVERPAGDGRRRRSTSCCPGRWPWRSSPTSLVNLGIATAYERTTAS